MHSAEAPFLSEAACGSCSTPTREKSASAAAAERRSNPPSACRKTRKISPRRAPPHHHRRRRRKKPENQKRPRVPPPQRAQTLLHAPRQNLPFQRQEIKQRISRKNKPSRRMVCSVFSSYLHTSPAFFGAWFSFRPAVFGVSALRWHRPGSEAT